MLVVAGVFIAGCEKPTEPPPVVRPVRSVVVDLSRASVDVWPAEIRARHETALSFRVGGQLLRRAVDVGAEVKAGQILAEVDPKDFRLAAQTANATALAARAQAELAEADLKRYRELRARNFISEAEYERREAQAKATRAQYDADRAEAERVANQAGYSRLAAPHAGVVTAVEAEAGQVVAVGQAVMRVARPGEREAAVAVPEARIDTLKQAGCSLEVRLLAAQDRAYPGKLRELAPGGDAASRTFAARIAIDGAGPEVRLGMSAQVTSRCPGSGAPRVPLTALTHRDGKTAVWVIDPAAMTVALQEVVTSRPDGDSVEIASGLAAGVRVVTAGVHVLQPGQKVRLLEPAK